MTVIMSEALWLLSLAVNTRKRQAWKRWQHTPLPIYKNGTNEVMQTELSANPDLSRRLFIQRHREISDYLIRHGSSVNAYDILNHLTRFWWEFVQSTQSGRSHYYPTDWILNEARRPGRDQPLGEDFQPVTIRPFANFDW